jgi:antitoxin (DNA-binding transcriptional repressor) of toxin-antitoxin stability system
MKVVSLEETNLDQCVADAQGDSVVIVRDGQPMALVVDVRGLDMEQIELTRSAEFWDMIRRRRAEPKISRAELERRLSES